MKTLTAASFTLAKNFVKQNARQLDRRVFEYHFENGTPTAVLDALLTYQNEDGGFGNALEPDFRLPDSSPLVTSIALQTMRQLGTPYDHPLVEHPIRYLLWAYDDPNKMWHAVRAEVNDFPHAPWWEFDFAAGKTAPESVANPTSEIVGLLQAWSALVPKEFLGRVTEFSIRQLLASPVTMELHDVLCYSRMANEMPNPDRLRMIERLTQAIDTIVARDPAQWVAYGPQPLMFARSPHSPFAESLRDALDLNLDYKIETQNADGSWSPNWSWGGAYPDTWRQAELEWRGYITVETLKSLKDFGRLED